MAPTTIRKVIGTVKDQTSIGIAKVSGTIAPELDVAIVKATSHDDEPADEKHLREILSMTSYSGGYVDACITAISRRLSKTRDWIVALKCLSLIHRLLQDGHPSFQQELLYATRKGSRLLNLADFRDEAHSSSWDHSAFVRAYAFYLDQRLECALYEKNQSGGGGSRGSHSDQRDHGDQRDHRDEYEFYGNGNGRREEQKKVATPVREMNLDRALGRMHQLQLLLDRFLACRPTGMAKHSRMIMAALYPVLKEGFQLYADVCELLALLLDRFFDMDLPDCSKAFDGYSRAAKQVDELAAFFAWSKEAGVARSSEYPEVQLISHKLLETLEEFMVDRARGLEIKPASPPAPEMNEIKALPAPEPSPPPPPPPEPEPERPPEKALPEQPPADLVDLRESSLTADDQGNQLALALFSGPAAAAEHGAVSGSGAATSSAWDVPAEENWELALVESASNLARQKPAMAGGLDPVLLDGMYDAGAVQRHTAEQMATGGSASSVALPVVGRTPVLALPAPDGTVQAVNQDPFAASLAVPPPSYVQMAEMEKKQQFLVQENMLWQQYAREGMQGQASLAKLSSPAAPAQYYYGMPAYYTGHY
ncbi:putative clathrin assembly protein At4g32285 [Wolffia australiana]